MTLATIEALVIAAIMTRLVMPMLVAVIVTVLPVLIALRLIETALLGKLRLGHLSATGLHAWLAAHAGTADAIFVAVVITEIVAVIGTAKALRTRHTGIERIAAALADLLLAEAHDDAVVVLGVLHVILSQHGIAGRQRITRQRHVFFGDV